LALRAGECAYRSVRAEDGGGCAYWMQRNAVILSCFQSVKKQAAKEPIQTKSPAIKRLALSVATASAWRIAVQRRYFVVF